MADDQQQGGGAMRVDAALVRELAELLAANDLTEIEVEDGDRKIKVRRELVHAPQAVHSVSAAPSAAATAPAPAAAAAEPPAPPTGEVVKCPMVGTAFLSAQPGGKPFAAAGETVKAGDTLLIVEAMKVMNPITAPRGGVVKQLLVADAQPVEFDQPLVILE